MLAPMVVVFYDAKWVEIGTKSSLEKLVSHTTRIRSTDHREEASTAQKTSRKYIPEPSSHPCWTEATLEKSES